MCSPGRMQGLFSCVQQLVWGRDSSLAFVARSLTCTDSKEQSREGITWQMRGTQGQLFCCHALGVSSQASLTTGSALGCCPGKVHACGEEWNNLCRG